MLKHVGLMSATAALVAGFATAPALAAPGSVTGTIDLDLSGARTTAVSPSLRFGDSAHFQTTADGRLDAKGYLYISVVCFAGNAFVYQAASRDLGYSFPLVDQSGQGLQWDGQAADCEAWLNYRIDKKAGGSTIEKLDGTTFTVVP
jgi:hypothetical protein